ncbi:hypothetical protein THII_3649 [Thioploca ingrica]|uniref:Uncharacterized protein n=1 Tax=Thioploca ingrica TaxID=40754 RepID=A0A090BW41_9GAMM|nr:hypothetical protein THII_3649 [Thioploca ingrica]
MKFLKFSLRDISFVGFITAMLLFSNPTLAISLESSMTPLDALSLFGEDHQAKEILSDTMITPRVNCFPTLSTDLKLSIPVLTFSDSPKVWYLRAELAGEFLPTETNNMSWNFQTMQIEFLEDAPASASKDCYVDLSMKDNIYFISIPKLLYQGQWFKMKLQETSTGVLAFNSERGLELASSDNPSEVLEKTIDLDKLKSLTSKVMALLTGMNEKKQIGTPEMEALDKSVEELGTNLSSQAMIALAIASSDVNAMLAFENIMTNISGEMQLVESLTDYTLGSQLQKGEILLTKEFIDLMPDQEVRDFLGEEGLRAHAAAKILSVDRAQAIQKLPIQPIDFTNESCPAQSSLSPQSSLLNHFIGNLFDVFVPKAEARVAAPCVPLCWGGVTSACMNCILHAIPQAYQCYNQFIASWNGCNSLKWWKRPWCKIGALARFVVCLA